MVVVSHTMYHALYFICPRKFQNMVTLIPSKHTRPATPTMLQPRKMVMEQLIHPPFPKGKLIEPSTTEID
jgi:hypothetical protein